MLVQICGPSGSGTTTLGKALNERLKYVHLDSDDFFWLPTDPPYTEKRPIEQRQELMQKELQNVTNGVITGCFMGWGDVFIPLLDLVVYLWVPTEIRIERLRQRELKELGVEALGPGGNMHENHKAFLSWASQYDSGGLDMRSRASHAEWLAKLSCPVLRIEGEVSLEHSLQLLISKIGELDSQT